jgi:hypothetical protein
LDEVFVKINGKLRYLCRAVDREGAFWKRSSLRTGQSRGAALKRIMKKYGRPRSVVTDGLRAYSAAMKEIGVADRQEVARNLFPGGVRDAADLSALKAAGSADALIATALHEGRVVRADLEAI